MIKLLKWFSSASWKIKAAVIVGAIILLAIFIVIKLKSDGKDDYSFDTVQKRTITEVVSESGNVSTRGVTNIRSPTKGVIEEIHVENGDIVGIDQDLFKVISTATEDEKASAYADLLSAQSSLKTAEHAKLVLEVSLEEAREDVLDARTDVHERNDNLIKDSNNPATGEKYTEAEIESIESALTSAIYDFNTTEKKYVEADISIAAAQANLNSYSLEYESTKSKTVKSPTIGTVSNLSVSVGDTVEIETLTFKPEPVLTIANFSSNVIIIDVSESDISKLEIGQKAVIDPDALEITYEGVVSRIDDIGQAAESGGVVNYKVYLDLVDGVVELKSGMTVDVDIATREEADVLSVPNAAVKPYQGGRAVRSLGAGGEIEFLPVELGIKGEDYTQIISGVEEDQQIVVSSTNGGTERKSPFGF